VTDELHASNQYCFDMRLQQRLLILDCSVQRRALLSGGGCSGS
jgi:hypothetical protein